MKTAFSGDRMSAQGLLAMACAAAPVTMTARVALAVVPGHGADL